MDRHAASFDAALLSTEQATGAVAEAAAIERIGGSREDLEPRQVTG